MNEMPYGGALHHCSFSSPLGRILAASTNKGICLLRWMEQKKPLIQDLDRILFPAPGGQVVLEEGECALLEKAEKHLSAYFSHGRPLPDLPLDFISFTPFQATVWNALRQIPHGKTKSYGQVALDLGKPGGARAVGQACAGNPIAILVPCHRVTAANGGLGGYSGGLHIKKLLLQIESCPRTSNLPHPPDS